VLPLFSVTTKRSSLAKTLGTFLFQNRPVRTRQGINSILIEILQVALIAFQFQAVYFFSFLKKKIFFE
jgi:hypothetical protein